MAANNTPEEHFEGADVSIEVYICVQVLIYEPISVR